MFKKFIYVFSILILLCACAHTKYSKPVDMKVEWKEFSTIVNDKRISFQFPVNKSDLTNFSFQPNPVPDKYDKFFRII